MVLLFLLELKGGFFYLIWAMPQRKRAFSYDVFPKNISVLVLYFSWFSQIILGTIQFWFVYLLIFSNYFWNNSVLVCISADFLKWFLEHFSFVSQLIFSNNFWNNAPLIFHRNCQFAVVRGEKKQMVAPIGFCNLATAPALTLPKRNALIAKIPVWGQFWCFWVASFVDPAF